MEIAGAEIAIDSEQELLVSKLCALLGRSEIWDLWDTQVLLGRAGSLEMALEVAPQKDAGFSSPTLAWVLESMDVAALGRAMHLPTDEVAALEAFRVFLVEQLLALSAPD